MWGSKNTINAIALTSVLPNKCFLQLDVVWTKLHSRLFDLNSLRQMKIIAVENKSIPSPVKSSVIPVSSNYLFIWHFSAETASLWEENTISALLGHSDIMQQSYVNVWSQYLSQVGMICLGSPRLLPEVLTLMLPIHSTVASTYKEMKNCLLQVSILSSHWANGLYKTYSDGWYPRGGLWMALKPKNGQVNSSAFLSSKMCSPHQQLEMEQLLVLSSSGGNDSLQKTQHRHCLHMALI